MEKKLQGSFSAFLNITLFRLCKIERFLIAPSRFLGDGAAVSRPRTSASIALLRLSFDFRFQGRSPGCFRLPSDLAALPALPRDTGDDRTQPYIRHYAEPVPEELGSRPVTSSTPLKFRARFDRSC